jgi:hypothetical protein
MELGRSLDEDLAMRQEQVSNVFDFFAVLPLQAKNLF